MITPPPPQRKIKKLKEPIYKTLQYNYNSNCVDVIRIFIFLKLQYYTM